MPYRVISPPSKKGPFWVGVVTGVATTIAVAAVGIVGTLQYMTGRADQSVQFAQSPAVLSEDNRVQMYFPLERFLTWRSTKSIQMDMQADTVHIHLNAEPFPSIGLTLSVDILGRPEVIHGDFALQDVSGYVDNIPLPKSLILGAIAADGARYGVHVNEARDTLFVVKTMGDYRLIGYDPHTRDLVLSLPVQAVERAARNQQVI